MQKWEYGTCRIYQGCILTASFPDRNGGKVEEHGDIALKDWSYRGDGLTFYDFCNSVGNVGWELVGFAPQEFVTPISGLASGRYELRAVFKRPKP